MSGRSWRLPYGSAMYKVRQSRWSQMRPGAELMIALRVPSPEFGPLHETGKLIEFDSRTSTGAPAIRLRTIGPLELLIPHAQIDYIYRHVAHERRAPSTT